MSIRKIRIKKHRTISFGNYINYEKIDLYNARDLVEIFKLQNNNGQEDIAIDMSGIQYIDSSGLGALATQGMYLSKKNKKLILLSVKSSVNHLFKTSGFDRIFKILPDKTSL